MRMDVSLPKRVPQSCWPRASAMKAFGVVRYCFQYCSSMGRTRCRSSGNGGSQSCRLFDSVMPGYSGA